MVTFGADSAANRSLVVDDDPVSQLVVQHVLIKEGWSVVTASSMAEALDVIAAVDEPLSIVICDYHMPGGSGLDLFEALRDRGIDAPFLLLTGIGEQAEVLDDRVDDVAGFLTKPVHSTDLLAAISSALGDRARPPGSLTPN